MVPADSPSPATIRVLLVDDSALLREGVCAVLQARADAAGIQIVGTAGSVHEAIARTWELRPDIVLLDVHLPDGYGYLACSQIAATVPTARVVMLTSAMDDTFIYESISAGAQGYLLKEIAPAALIDAIRQVAAGKSAISPDQVTRMMNLIRQRSEKPDANFTLLSPQEKRILDLVGQGKTNKEIAETLGLSQNTVKNYLSNAFEKLNVRGRTQAAAMYLRPKEVATRPKRA